MINLVFWSELYCKLVVTRSFAIVLTVAAPLIQCNLWCSVESIKSVRECGYSRLYWFTYAYIRLCFITLKIWNSEHGASHNVGLICCCLESVKSVREYGYSRLYWFTYAYSRLCFITSKIWNSEHGASHSVGLICCCLESVKSVTEWCYNSLCKTPCSELKIKTICCKTSCILYCKTLWSAFITINVDYDGNNDDVTKFNNKSCAFHYTITWSWNVFNGNMSSNFTCHPWQMLALRYVKKTYIVCTTYISGFNLAKLKWNDTHTPNVQTKINL